MADSLCGTTPCPQIIEQSKRGVLTCGKSASVYRIDGTQTAYRSSCADGHVHYFGEDYMPNVAES